MKNPIETNHYDLVIVGAGPVGLLVAVFACLGITQPKILIIEKRSKEETTLRSQSIILNHLTQNALKSLIKEKSDLNDNDINFIDKLSSSPIIKLKAIQKFILNRLKDPNAWFMRIRNFTLEYEKTITSVNLAQGIINVKDNQDNTQSISFSHLVEADGAKAETLQLVNAGLEKEHREDKQIHRTTPSQLKHIEMTYHLVVYMRIKRKDGEDIVIPKREFGVGYFEASNSYTWLLNSSLLFMLRVDHQSHNKSEHKSAKLSFIGEIPKDLYDQYMEVKQRIDRLKTLILLDKYKDEREIFEERMQWLEQQNQELVIDYVKKAIISYYHYHHLVIAEDDLDIEITSSKKHPAKDHLKILVHQGQSKQALKPATEVNGHLFCLIGDAAFTPQYPSGTGFNHAANLAKLFIDFIYKVPNIPGNINFEKQLKEMQDKLDKFIKLYNDTAKYDAQNTIQYMRKLYWIDWVKHFKLNNIILNLDHHRFAESVEIFVEENINNLKEFYNDKNLKNSIDSYLNKKFRSINKLIDDYDRWDYRIVLKPTLANCFHDLLKVMKNNPTISKYFVQEISSYLKNIYNQIRGVTIPSFQALCTYYMELLFQRGLEDEKIGILPALQDSFTLGVSSVIEHCLEHSPSAISEINPDELEHGELVQLLIKCHWDLFQVSGVKKLIINDKEFPATPFALALEPGRLFNLYQKLPLGIQLLLELRHRREPLFSQAMNKVTPDFLEAVIKSLKEIDEENFLIFASNKNLQVSLLDQIQPKLYEQDDIVVIRSIKNFAIEILANFQLNIADRDDATHSLENIKSQVEVMPHPNQLFTPTKTNKIEEDGKKVILRRN